MNQEIDLQKLCSKDSITQKLINRKVKILNTSKITYVVNGFNIDIVYTKKTKLLLDKLDKLIERRALELYNQTYFRNNQQLN